MDAKIIIMDEPTTSLTDPEIEKVFAILRQLRQQKVGIVFISHKLRGGDGDLRHGTRFCATA